MEPVELTIITRNQTKEGLNEIIRDTNKVGQTVEQVTADFKARMKEQSEVVKQVEADIKALEKQLEKAAPGKGKMALAADLEAAKKVLIQEKNELSLLDKQVNQTSQKHQMLRTEIRNLKEQMAGMTEGTEEYAAAMQRLGEMQDRMGDINTQGKIFSDDNKNIKSTMDAVSGLTGALTVGIGVASLFGVEEEKLAQIQTKLQAVMAITMGVQQVANTLNKDSYFTHGLLADAKNMLTAANARLAVSLGISNVAAQALMATLTLGLSVVITGLIVLWNKYSNAQDEAKRAQEAATEAAKKQAEAENELRKSAAESVSAQLLEYKKLQKAYQDLGDDIKKKKKFVDENKKSFEELGISVRGVKDAENLLIDGEEAFLRTMNNRALIAASMELAAEKYKEAIAKMMEVDAKKKKAQNYSDKDLDEDDRTLASRMAAGEMHKKRGGNFLEGLSDENMEEKLKEYAQTGNKFYVKVLEEFNLEKTKAIETITEQNKGALERNAEEERKNVEKFLNEGAESLKNGTKLTQENKDIFQQAGFVPFKKTEKVSFDKEAKGNEMADAEIKARQKINDMTIALMEDGAAKKKALARKQFDDELARIDQEERERLKALQNAQKNGMAVTPEQVATVRSQAKQQRDLAGEQYIKEFFSVEKEYADKSKKLKKEKIQAQIEYDKEYGTYQEKRLAIETEFNAHLADIMEKRKEAAEKGDTDTVEIMNIALAKTTKDKGKALIGLDYEQLKQSPDYIRAFENLKETSSETLKSLLAQFEAAKQTAAQVLSPDQLREYTTTIQDIMNELDERNPFQALADRKKELAEAEEELAEAKRNLETVNSGGKVVAGSSYNRGTDKIEKTYLSSAEALEKYNKAKDKAVKANAKVEAAEKKVDDVINDLSRSINEIGNAIGGQAGEIISLIGDIGEFAMMAMNGVETASQTASAAIRAVENASVILAIISAAIQLATKVASIFGSNEAEERKQYIEQLNAIADIYDKIIDKQKESIKFGYGFAAIEAAKKAMEDLNKQTEQYRKIAETAGKEKGKGALAYKYLDEYKKILETFDINGSWSKLTGIDTSGLATLTGKQLEEIRESYIEIWSALPEEQRKALEAIIDAEEKGKDIIDEWQEAITGISYDSFYTEFIDVLSDMDTSAEDMAKNFGEYLRKSIIASMVAKNFQKDINALYDTWVSAGNEKSDGGIEITPDEAKTIQEKYKDLVEAMTQARDNMSEAFGWEKSYESQSGRAGAVTTITEETAGKIEGIATAIQIRIVNMDDNLTDISQYAYEAIGILNTIAENTAFCKYLPRIADGIDRMERDGVKMK